MKIDGAWVSEKLAKLCDEIDCPRGVAGDCLGCPIDAAQQAIHWHGEFETEYQYRHFHDWQKGYFARCGECDTVVEGDIEEEE